MQNHILSLAILVCSAAMLDGAEFHVAIKGGDTNAGTRRLPLRTIQRAADLAQPGDTITVHEGVYRERVNPPRGGESDQRRVVYQAAKGERVEITGSEVVTGWTKVQNNAWKVTLPNSFFGGFNPFTNVIRGDWFDRRGREHHTGAVYLNGEWLTEATKLDEVLMAGSPAWVTKGERRVLLNIAALRVGKDGEKIPATKFTARQGTTNAPCAEGGECLGWIMPGDWVRFDQVAFPRGCKEIEIRTASASEGGVIELRLDGPEGELIGSCTVSNTGGWQAWAPHRAAIESTSGTKNLCLTFRGHKRSAVNPRLWFAEVDKNQTTIWAQFPGVNPNQQNVEINSRQTVFYPDRPGRNFITVRGFILRHAATPWAPPTAEQIGLIGTHWSKGWIIENNVVSHSISSGIALGKHGDEFDNTSADTAEGYVKTIERAHAFRIPWTKEHIGHHIVRDNTVSHCEQAGIVGSLGCAFSTVTGNVIHDIHVRRLFSGAEMAGIKFHGAIDTTVRANHIFRTVRGLWLDWMAQGTRVSENLFHDNIDQDLFVEVNHGPFVVDNNVFLSSSALLDMSQGGAYLHNLFAGRLVTIEEPGRKTPFHPPHTTIVAGLTNIQGGDNCFLNNVFIGNGHGPGEVAKDDKRHRRVSGYGLWVYDLRAHPLLAAGNVHLHGARPWTNETATLALTNLNPAVHLVQEARKTTLHLALAKGWNNLATTLAGTPLLGTAKIPQLPYVNPDGSTITIATDYFGKKRNADRPTPGPFEKLGNGSVSLKVR